MAHGNRTRDRDLEILLTRRGLLRASLAATAASMAAASGQSVLALQPDATPIATPADAAPPLAIDGSDAEIWAWQKEITGSCGDVCSNCENIWLDVAGDAVPVTVEGDRFAATASLREGDNQVVAICEYDDSTQVSSDPVTYTVRLEERPTARIRPLLENDRIILDGTVSTPNEATGAPIVDYHWSAREDNPAAIDVVNADEPNAPANNGEVQAERIEVTPPDVNGEYYFSLRVVDNAGREDYSATYFVVENGQPRLVDFETQHAAWIDSAVVYGAIVRNMTDQGFLGVIDRLDYLRDLGITAIWFAPINRTIADLFGYEVTNYFELRPEYGSKEDFRQLVQEAHARGIRVLMDFVPNHTSAEHRYFREAEAEGPESHYWDFYDRNEQGVYTYYFEWFHLPNLNFDNPEVERFMTEAFAYWVREFDVDGFRVDVAWGLKERKPDYWPRWREEMKRIKPDILLIAEASARDPYYFENGFDTAFDWTDQLGHWAWGEVFGGVMPIGLGMEGALTNHGDGYHPDALVFRFLNNNDTGFRFITSYGLDLYRVASAMLLTLPGLPGVYTGDEIGAEFLPYETTWPIDWDDRHDLYDYFRELIALRREHPSLHSREWALLDVESDGDVFGYLRHTEANDQPVFVLLNFSAAATEAVFPLPEGFSHLAPMDSLTDLLTDEHVELTGGDHLTIPLAPWAVRILDGHTG